MFYQKLVKVSQVCSKVTWYRVFISKGGSDLVRTSIDPTLENSNVRNLLYLEGTPFVGQFLLVIPFIKLSV